MTTVTIDITSDDPSPVDIAGVVVEFYTTDAVFQTSGTTDSGGSVVVSLPDAAYDVVFFKTGVSILPSQPQRITVDHTQPTNTFSVIGHIRAAPESTDPTLCTVSGYVMGVDGRPVVTHRLIFEPVQSLLVLSGNVIAPFFRVEFSSDDTGYFQFELLRKISYKAYFVFPQDLFGRQPGKLDVITPDLPAVALNNFLYPLPINCTFSSSTISLVHGTGPDTSVTVTLAFTDGSARLAFGTPWAGIEVTNTNNLVVTASLLDDGTLDLIPMSAGTATITTVREIPSSVTFDPLPTYTSDTIVVTVT